jgi:predicted methyltransferase
MRTLLLALAASAALAGLAAPTLASAQSSATPIAVSPAIRAAVDAPGRSAKDRERDARERPADVLGFAGVAPGMTVADIFGGGGYYSEIVAGVVGASGRTLLVNNAPYLMFAGKDLEQRFANGRLPQVERSVVESCNLGLAPESLDVAMIVMSYHDLYHYDPRGWPRIDAAAFLEQIRRAVKPGGAFLIVDHAAKPGTGNASAQELHRIDEQFAIADIEKHGFVLEKRWDGLRNPADDYSAVVFDPKVRGRTDRFVHLYRRKS